MTDEEQAETGATKEPADEGAKAKDELFEAIDHFKRAANLLFDRAAKDPKVKTATVEAERVIRKLGDSAEPLARQLTSELAKLTRRVSEGVSEAVESRKKDRKED